MLLCIVNTEDYRDSWSGAFLWSQTYRGQKRYPNFLLFRWLKIGIVLASFEFEGMCVWPGWLEWGWCSHKLQVALEILCLLLFSFIGILESVVMGCDGNFSTKSMRSDGGYEVIKKAIEKLGLRHKEHIAAYGDGNERRLTGRHETADIHRFIWVN